MVRQTRDPRALQSGAAVSTIRRMAPRPRKELDPKSDRYEIRFAIHLRDLLEKRGLTPIEFIQKVQDAGIDVSTIAIRKWIAGDHIPRPQDTPAIARVLGLDDYRHLWPPIK